MIIDDTDEAAKRAIVEQMNARFAYVSPRAMRLSSTPYRTQSAVAASVHT